MTDKTAQNGKLVVIGCSQLLTLRGPARPRVGPELADLGIIEDGAMLIESGRITRVCRRADMEPLIDSKTSVIDAEGRVVMPGFVDAHTHPVFAGTRAGEFEQRISGATYQEIAAAGGGIRSTVRQTRAATEDELVASSKRYSNWFLRGGTTTVEAKSGYGLSVEDELKMLRSIRRLNAETSLRYVPTFLGAHEIPDEFRGRTSEYVDLIIEEMLPLVAKDNLAAYCDVFCERGVFNADDSRRVLLAAKRFGLGLRVHADQLSPDAGGASLAAELKAATADHLEHTGVAGIKALAAAGVQPVLLPGAVYALSHTRYPAAREMIEAGLAIVLATDFNPGSSPTTSMLMVLSLAATQMRLIPAEAITATTLNAAYSLGLGNEIGSLEIGKRADFVVHDCDDYRELAYFYGIEHAHWVYRDGERV